MINTGWDRNLFLRRIQEFVNPETGIQNIETGTLACASYWVGMRQEIYVAVMNAKPLSIDMVDSLVDRKLTEADDYTWSNRAVAHCADVINLCFGQRSAVDFPQQWEKLKAWNAEWRCSRPDTWTPIYSENWDGNPGTFPKRLYLSSCLGMSSRWRSMDWLVSPSFPFFF